MAKKHHKESTHEKKEHEEHHAVRHKKDAPYWKYTTAVFAVLSVFLVAYIIQVGPVAGNKNINTVADETVKFINANLLSGGSTAMLVNATFENGLYKIALDIGGNKFDSYVTVDGELLFPSTIDMTAAPAEEPTTPDQPPEVPKTDKPVVNIFVMSYCPYGLQMEKAAIPVMELLGDKAEINIDYVDYIMHGEKEIKQNNYQHCIEAEQPSKFVAYLRCFVQSDDHAKCMTETGIDSAKLDTCVAGIDSEFNITGLYNDQSTWNGGSYPQYNVDAVLGSKYGVGGSPTVVINGKTMSVSRSPEAFKQAVCGAFNTPPVECGQTLSSTSEGPGIGAMGGGGSDTTASCG